MFRPATRRRPLSVEDSLTLEEMSSVLHEYAAGRMRSRARRSGTWSWAGRTPLREVGCLVVSVALGIASPSSAQVPRTFDDAWRELAASYHRTLDESGVVGSSLWVFRDGEPVAREFHGFADLETGRGVDENTIFHWASNTKTFTAIAIMQLRERGLLSLDDPIMKYLPELRGVHNPHGPMEAITLRHLLTHSAGFRAPTWPWGGGKDWQPHEPTEWSQIVALIPYTEILFPPGSRYSYSNPGIIFLGRVIEILSGDDYEVYVDKNILKPLGMHSSYFDGTPYHLLQYRSNSYTIRDGEPVANGFDFDTGITVSNGGLNAPITDMAKYLAFLAGDDEPAGLACDPRRPCASASPRVLSRASLEEMWRGQLPVGEAGDSIGLGFFIGHADSARYIGHDGSQKSFLSFFSVDPGARTAAIAAFNTVGESGKPPKTGHILSELRRDLLGNVLPLLRDTARAESGGPNQ